MWGAWRPLRQQTRKQRRYPAQPGGKVNRPTAATATVAIAFSRGGPRKKSPLKTSTHYQVKIRVSLEATGHGQKQQLVHRTGTSCNIPALPYIPRSRNKFPSRLVRPRNLIGLILAQRPVPSLVHQQRQAGPHHTPVEPHRRMHTPRSASFYASRHTHTHTHRHVRRHKNRHQQTHVEAQAPT